MLWPVGRMDYEPFSAVRNLQRQMNRLFDDVGVEGEPYPAVNIWSNDDEVVLTAEIAGVHPDDLNITVLDDQLTIEGERKESVLDEETTYHRRERGTGRFIRSFRLPYAVESDKVNAKFKNGILELTMPRAEVSKPKKISIAAK